MTHRWRLLPIIAVIALIGAACADDTTEEAPQDPVEEDAGAGDGDEDGSADDGEDAADDDAGGDDAADADEDGSAAGPDRTSGTLTTGVEVATSDLGDHLVTAEGRTVYAAVDQRDGEVVCVADCAQVWPPVIVDGEPTVGDGVDAELVTTITLDDGREQLVLDGAPLHTFVVDAAAGELRGQGSADRWFVVSPAGELIGADGQ